ncbi:MAG: molybdopterin molybdenumtransferase MoeA [Fimbriimonadales bacterium]|nr:MAG: molybdopterin molybdenumtransferase MoeA [Fimbriimonadales bacterium]
MKKVSLNEAMETVSAWAAQAQAQATESVPLDRACGRVLAEPAAAQTDYPAFDNSAVDGYVIAVEADAAAGTGLRVVGAVAAGACPPEPLAPGTTYRILTGAPVPQTAYAVIMQEDVALLGSDRIRLETSARAGEHIRRRGTDFRAGDILITPGTRLNPGHLGLLATLGVPEPVVRVRPKVAILTTGDEIVAANAPVASGKVRDSNGPMLAAMVERFGGEPFAVQHVPDEEGALAAAVEEGLGEARVVVITGGASVGDRDYAPNVASRFAEVLFHGVSVKPGKPTLFASAGDRAVLGLPGNPGATFVGAHLYLRPILAGLQRERYKPRWIAVRFRDTHRARERDDLLRARLDWTTSPPTAFTEFEQGSFALTSLAECDCLVRFPAGAEHAPGDERQALLLDDR